jgi:hypothetical protein
MNFPLIGEVSFAYVRHGPLHAGYLCERSGRVPRLKRAMTIVGAVVAEEIKTQPASLP